MKIKEVEEQIGITKANIRYYEKEGLLDPKRDRENNYREYSQEDIRSLERIKVLRLLGITIGEIRQLDSGQLLLKDVIENRLERIAEEEKNLLEVKRVCRTILENNISFMTVDEHLFDGRKENWHMELERIWHEDITKELLTRKQYNQNIAVMLLWGYLINVVMTGLFGTYFVNLSETDVIRWLVFSSVTGSLCYIGVYVTASMKIHLLCFHASALLLTPLVISVYRFFRMLFDSSETSAKNPGRVHVLVFWTLLMGYTVIFFCLAEKWGTKIKDVHVAALSAVCTLLVTAVFLLLWREWLFPAVMVFTFTMYAGTVWKDGLVADENCNRYYAVSTGSRIINICGAFWSMYGKTSTSGWVRR